MDNVKFSHTYTLSIPVHQFTANDPKLTMLFLTQVVDIIADTYGGPALIGACVDTGGKHRINLTFTTKANANSFQHDWTTVAKRIRDESAAHHYTTPVDDIPF